MRRGCARIKHDVLIYEVSSPVGRESLRSDRDGPRHVQSPTETYNHPSSLNGVRPHPIAVRIDSWVSEVEERCLANDVLDGLTRPFKELPPKHFYDTRGSELFDRICELPEYYPTRAEMQLLSERAGEIVELTGAGELVELGPGGTEQGAPAARSDGARGNAAALHPARRLRGRGARRVPTSSCATMTDCESTGSSGTSSAILTTSPRRTACRAWLPSSAGRSATSLRAADARC